MSKNSIDISQLFEVLPDQILILVDERGIIIDCNQEAAGMIGMKPQQLKTKNFDNCFGPIDQKTGFSFDVLTKASTKFHNHVLTNTQNEHLDTLIKVSKIRLNNKKDKDYYLIAGQIHKRSSNLEQELFDVMQGTSKEGGIDFFNSVTKALAKTLGVKYSFVGELYHQDGQERIKTRSFWKNKKHVKQIDYNLKGSPCELVVNKSQLLVSENVANLYPEDEGLKKLKAESYYGTPIFYSNGSPMGLLVVMDTKLMLPNTVTAYILNIYANRIGSEMEWLNSQTALRKSESRLSTIINTIPSAIYYKDSNGYYEGANLAFMKGLGVKKEDFVGKKVIGNPKDTIQRQELMSDEHLLKHSGELRYEIEFPIKNKIRNVMITKSSIPSENGGIEGIVGAATDITHLKSAQQELELSEEKYRTLFSQASDAIFIMNEDIFIDCNEKTLEMFNCSKEEIIGHPPYEFSPEIQPNGRNSKKEALVKINGALRGEPQNFYWQHKKKNQQLFDAEVSLNAYYLKDELYIQAIVRDVSERMAQANAAVLQQQRMEYFHQLTSNYQVPFEEVARELIAFTTESLGLEFGILSKITDADYTVLETYNKDNSIKKGDSFCTKDTYCDITFQSDKLITINDMSSSPYLNHPCYEMFKLEAYIGIPYWVQGKKYGTISFGSSTPVHSFQNIDADFVRLIAQWISYAMERSLYETKLEERDALLETMLKEIPVDFSVRDADLNMVWQSDLSKKTWGDNEGKPIDYSDVDEESQKKWKDIFSRALQGEQIKGEDTPLIYGHSAVFYSIVSPIYHNDEVKQVVVVNIDIAKLKKTEQQLTKQNTALKKLNEELDRFVYSASHDLRAPLASVLGLIDLSSREQHTPDSKQYLQLMERSIRTMDNFISDITEYSRNLRLKIKEELIDVSKLIQDSFEHVKYMGNIQAKLNISIKGKHDFYSDPDRLKLILNNLLSNSIRYKAPGRTPVIDMTVVINPELAIFKISDNGIGIKSEHLEKVFDMFYRANDRNSGSGLGLFIVNESIKKLDGHIAIESTPDLGTTVTFELPNKKNKQSN